MKFVADFHIHSKFSRATSKDMDVEALYKWAKIKGITVLGTGDFTHPEWLKILRSKLEPAEPGLLKLKNHQELSVGVNSIQPRFILTTEISCIYSKKGRVRKIHLVVFSPSFEVCEKINTHLGWIGNLRADGRPILGVDAKELTKIILGVSSECAVVPAHAWTPWFSIFGSKSGFNSIEECFEEYSPYIFAIETGLSSDPPMNWRVSALDRITLISNSDSHSPQKIGREANVFNTDLNYKSIMDAIRSKNPQRFLFTVEFFPEEGKYHYDGHRLCSVRFAPEESKRNQNICPTCKKPLTIGVLNRVAELADRPEGAKPEGAIPFFSLVPLEEIIADALGQTTGTKAVAAEYKSIIEKFGSELEILLNVSPEYLKNATLPEIAEGIVRVRERKVQVEPGYDGEYGKIRIFGDGEQKKLSKQTALF